MNDLKWQCQPFNQLSVNEWHDIIRLRIAVFVVEQDCIYQDLDGKDLKAWHLMGWQVKTDHPSLWAYSRLLPVGLAYPDAASIGRIITSAAARGKGLGHALMKASIEQICQIHGQCTIRISAQHHLMGFYKKWNFQAVGEPYQEDGILHIEMLKN